MYERFPFVTIGFRHSGRPRTYVKAKARRTQARREYIDLVVALQKCAAARFVHTYDRDAGGGLVMLG